MEKYGELLETWDIGAKICEYFLAAVDPSALDTKPAKGRTVRNQFIHIHNVRGMWIKSASPILATQFNKLEPGTPLEMLLKELSASRNLVRQLIEQNFESGVVKGFKPHLTAFIGYLISHESHHRGMAELVLREIGSPISDKVSFGLWEWNSRK